ncbi:MAG: hypothetical protein QF595_01625 [Dehalococcoidia bacterium]|jgi:hypothetical protein|nr:hypothetical protein [Dehalococcoidia bacterium]
MSGEILGILGDKGGIIVASYDPYMFAYRDNVQHGRWTVTSSLCVGGSVDSL